MLDFATVIQLSEAYNVPLEDVLFIGLNTSGVNRKCDYNRMRMAFRFEDSNLFRYAKERGELDYYFALPINEQSPFGMNDEILSLGDTVIGHAIGATEDICNDNYSRRGGTCLNINPNSRTSCSGCHFCYTAYQVPNDLKRMQEASDLRQFFENWMNECGLASLSHLIQVSVVTGCYSCSEQLTQFLCALKSVLDEYDFSGKIFYLGSQITSKEDLSSLREIQPFGISFSLETFERRELLRDKKREVTIQHACDSMDFALELGYEVNFSYIVGTEPLDRMEYFFNLLKGHINKMPTINTLQMHKYHHPSLVDPSASCLEYYLKARVMLESIFAPTEMRPLVWEDYRSLWFLTFGTEPLNGVRTP